MLSDLVIQRKELLKMKKSKILVPAIALLALGVAGSTVGTVAWFTAGTITPTPGSVGSGTITATTEIESLGSFTVNVTNVAIADPTISLTNTAGETYLWDGHNNIKAPVQTTTYSNVTVSMSVVYAGDITDAASIKALWEQSASQVSLKVEDLSADAELPDGKTRIASGGGVKLSSVSGTAAVASTSHTLDPLACDLLTGADFSVNNTATFAAAAEFYVGLIGVDSVEQKPTDYYTIKVSPQVGAAS